MNSLDTTNIILAILTATAVAQFLVVMGIFIWMGKRVTALQRKVADFESTHLAGITQRANALLADFHMLADRVDRIGAEVERTAKSVQGVVKTVEVEVDRTTQGVHHALGLVSGGYRQLSAVGAGLKAGVQELLGRNGQRRERALDRDAVARFEAGA